MKKLLTLSIALLIAGVLTACGGEDSNDTATNHADSKGSGELILDNGRGTVNGRDTELPNK